MYHSWIGDTKLDCLHRQAELEDESHSFVVLVVGVYVAMAPRRMVGGLRSGRTPRLFRWGPESPEVLR